MSSAQNNKEKDMVEEILLGLSEQLGCGYLSDLHEPPFRDIAQNLLSTDEYRGLPPAVWGELLEYLGIAAPPEVAEEQAKEQLRRQHDKNPAR